VAGGFTGFGVESGRNCATAGKAVAVTILNVNARIQARRDMRFEPPWRLSQAILPCFAWRVRPGGRRSERSEESLKLLPGLDGV
jgi:hypothetical protein